MHHLASRGIHAGGRPIKPIVGFRAPGHGPDARPAATRGRHHRDTVPVVSLFSPTAWTSRSCIGQPREGPPGGREKGQSRIRKRRALPAPVCAAASPAPTSKLGTFVDENFIPLALLTAASFGWLVPSPGEIAHSYKVQKLSTIGQFVISGMVLQASQVVAALKSPFPILYGVLSILFVTPLLGIAVMALPWIHPFEFKVGMAVFCCVPTTLSSCVALANQCNGNAAVALMLVVLTSTLGVFTIPTVLGFVLGSTSLGPGAFNQRELLRTLILTVLCPLFAGIALQRLRAVSAWKDRNRKVLARMSTMFLCITPWLQLSIASAAQLPIGPGLIFTGLALGTGVHLAFLALNMSVTGMMRFSADPKEHVAIRKALILCTSEKTLPVAVAVISQLGVLTPANMAFAILPCIFSHILQTVIDSALVGRWNHRARHLGA